MVILGVVLLILGLIFSISVLWIIGLVLVVVGALLWVIPVGGSTHRYY